MSKRYKKVVNLLPFMIISLLFCSISVKGQKYCAVLDLVSDGTIPKKNCTLIADKISEIVATKSNYMAFDRNILPELLQQFSLEKNVTKCFNPQCLARVGNLIGANAIIGGTIVYKNKLIEVRLYLIDVPTRQTLSTVSLKTKSKKNMFLNSELPALMKNLLNPPEKTAPKTNQMIAKKSNFYTNPIFYVGTFIVGSAAAGAYYFKYYYNNNESNSTNDQPLSMDDVPVRSRE